MTFDDFWQLYPRKEASAKGRVMWDRLTEEEKTLAMEALPNHIKRWKALGTEREFIPLPASWLNPKLGRRWEDEIVMPTPSNWWESDEATMAFGRSKGIPAKPGENMAGYRARLRAA